MTDLIQSIRNALDEAEAQARDWANNDGDAFWINEAGRALLRHIATDRKLLDAYAEIDAILDANAFPDGRLVGQYDAWEQVAETLAEAYEVSGDLPDDTPS